MMGEFRGCYRELPTPLDSVYPGVSEATASIARSGMPIAICSNKRELHCRKILDDTALTEFCGTIVDGDTVAQFSPCTGTAADVMLQL